MNVIKISFLNYALTEDGSYKLTVSLVVNGFCHTFEYSEENFAALGFSVTSNFAGIKNALEDFFAKMTPEEIQQFSEKTTWTSAKPEAKPSSVPPNPFVFDSSAYVPLSLFGSEAMVVDRITYEPTAQGGFIVWMSKDEAGEMSSSIPYNGLAILRTLQTALERPSVPKQNPHDMNRHPRYSGYSGRIDPSFFNQVYEVPKVPSFSKPNFNPNGPKSRYVNQQSLAETKKKWPWFGSTTFPQFVDIADQWLLNPRIDLELGACFKTSPSKFSVITRIQQPYVSKGVVGGFVQGQIYVTEFVARAPYNLCFERGLGVVNKRLTDSILSKGYGIPWNLVKSDENAVIHITSTEGNVVSLNFEYQKQVLPDGQTIETLVRL